MLIVADENIPYAREAFSTLGEVRLAPGRAMDPASVRPAEMLLVRSVTPVGPALLEGSRVRFVGSATIGTDHVDVGYLKSRGIRFAAAPGSNANSVAEYVIAALLVIAERTGRELAGRSLGVVGAGNVGGRVAAKARALGMRVVLNDPPLQRKTGNAEFRPLDEVTGCDFITLHVPLERGGPDPTWHLADARFLGRMRPDAVLLNTSRGAVADNAALLRALESGGIAAAVLDVWEGEPRISTSLLRRVAIGTPHVAGYSLDGKVNGTVMLYREACEFLGVTPAWRPDQLLPPAPHARLTIQTEGRADEEVLREAVKSVYPIERDDAALRRVLALSIEQRGPYFDRLRKEYPVRREFQNTTVTLIGPPRPALVDKLRGIGFNVR